MVLRATGSAIAFVFFASMVPASHALQDEGQVALRVVELGSRPQRPVASATVRILDRDGKVLAHGITAADGTYETAVRMVDPLIVEWSKKGYVREPERKTVAGRGPTVQLELDLIRRSADDAYYRAVAQDIKAKADATGGAHATATYKEQAARIEELSPKAQNALTGELRSLGVAHELRRSETVPAKPRATQEKPIADKTPEDKPSAPKSQIKEPLPTQDRLKTQERKH
jgi:hypothetical protein